MKIFATEGRVDGSLQLPNDRGGCRRVTANFADIERRSNIRNVIGFTVLLTRPSW